MFGLKHVIILVICLALIVSGAVFLRKLKLKSWYGILLGVGIVSETVKIVYYVTANEGVYGGYLPKTDLPFQLCSIQLLFIALLNFTKSEKLHRFLLAFMLPSCLIGGIAAMLIPTSSSLSAWPITFQYFIYHTVIVTFSVYLFGCKEINWTVGDYFNSLKMLGLMAFIAVYLNSMFFDLGGYEKVDGVENVIFARRVNFMYVVDPPAEGLPLLNKNHGWFVYIINYAWIAVTALTLCYIKPVIKAVAAKFLRRPQAENEPENDAAITEETPENK
ncbi:MAG: YwaF family protein [Clostridia bacterium]|nr:YwaF family protein [Clostridia bacterium]